jgi:hypothetical protein
MLSIVAVWQGNSALFCVSLVPLSWPLAASGLQIPQKPWRHRILNWRWAALASIAATVFLGGCGNNAPPFNSTPAISNLFPSNIVAGSPDFNLSVVGTGFIATAKGASFVYWNGFPRSTTLNQTTGQLAVQIFASDVATPGTVDVTVTSPAPGGGTSTAMAFTVETAQPGAPALDPSSPISPRSAKAGGAAFTLTVNGASGGGNFQMGDVATWNGTVLATTFVNSVQLTASVPANNIASVGSASVAVFTSNLVVGSPSVNFAITGPDNPKPTASSLKPSSAAAGSADTEVLVDGSGFTALSTARWTVGGNTTPLALAYLSGSQVILLVPTANLTHSGTAMIEISNPAPGGGTSSQLSFTVSGG